MTEALRTEPLTITWKGGTASVGYLGRRTWRYVSHHGAQTAADSKMAAGLLMEEIFGGVPAGREVELRTPIKISVPGRQTSLVVDERMTNGWTHYDEKFQRDGLRHEDLPLFFSDLLASNAERVWARGVKPLHHAALGDQFAFPRFAADADAVPRCQRLAAALDQRLEVSAWPPTVLAQAIEELRALGHDLWSFTPDEVWGPDYVTRRPGAGLLVTLFQDDDDDGDAVASEAHVQVEFQRPELDTDNNP